MKLKTAIPYVIIGLLLAGNLFFGYHYYFNDCDSSKKILISKKERNLIRIKKEALPVAKEFVTLETIKEVPVYREKPAEVIMIPGPTEVVIEETEAIRYEDTLSFQHEGGHVDVGLSFVSKEVLSPIEAWANFHFVEKEAEPERPRLAIDILYGQRLGMVGNTFVGLPAVGASISRGRVALGYVLLTQSERPHQHMPFVSFSLLKRR